MMTRTNAEARLVRALLCAALSSAACVAEIPEEADTEGVTSALLSPGCWIRNQYCPTAPHLTAGAQFSANRGRSFFRDAFPEAQGNEARCLARAVDFANWCGAAPSYLSTSTALYVRPDGSRSEEEVAWAPGCELRVYECPAHPETPRTIYETFEGADRNESRCHQRAAEYAAYCQLDTAGRVRANFFQGTHNSHHVAYGVGCRIEVATYQSYARRTQYLESQRCPNHPDVPDRFSDAHDGAATSPERCMARAEEYRRWCGQDEPHEYVVAQFYDRAGAEPVAETVAAAPGCLINGYCRADRGSFTERHPERSEEACLERLRERSNECDGWADDLIVFYSTGSEIRHYVENPWHRIEEIGEDFDASPRLVWER